MPFFAILINLFTGGLSLFKSFTSGLSSYTLIIFKFLKFYIPKAIKVGFLAFLFTEISSLIIFGIYNVVYGSAVASSYFITPLTINIIFYALIGIFRYIAYVFIFRE